MLECAEEKETQHYLGDSQGFGPVDDSEYIYFAVFEKTPRDGDRLSADSFDNKALKRSGQSVSRASHTSRKVFDNDVVRTGANPKGALQGVATALVGTIRSLRSRVKLNSTEISVRAFCVLDHVLSGDYDSHATIQYGVRTSDGLSENQISKIRTKARLDLADVFGPILSDADVSFAADGQLT
jgi:hypothetical protein